jgi:hypothetical protein
MKLDCGCEMVSFVKKKGFYQDEWKFCPLHAAAGEMLAWITTALDDGLLDWKVNETQNHWEAGRVLIAKAKGEKHV